MPPVAGEERTRFIEQAQLDFQDFAIIGDATWTFDDGVLDPDCGSQTVLSERR